MRKMEPKDAYIKLITIFKNVNLQITILQPF